MPGPWRPSTTTYNFPFFRLLIRSRSVKSKVGVGEGGAGGGEGGGVGKVGVIGRKVDERAASAGEVRSVFSGGAAASSPTVGGDVVSDMSGAVGSGDEGGRGGR